MLQKCFGKNIFRICGACAVCDSIFVKKYWGVEENEFFQKHYFMLKTTHVVHLTIF
eukprot:TRINITY_DN4545_c0_g1_i1.p1 TRINITY_DN4545_c0_g1~~TRINITY_DN4545_c0_g1_i1.p1  ORF type:complete len:56 (+),score=5.90 TRINITY_DN4545_c0_g1_i1:132-299(+)